MQTHATDRDNRVLELAGDGSRTNPLQLAEEQATAKLSVALPDNPRAEIRPMEAVWFLIAAVLFSAHLESSDVSQQVIAEKRLEGCAAQYAAGERWSRTNPLKCAPMVEAPNYILSMPLSQR